MRSLWLLSLLPLLLPLGGCSCAQSHEANDAGSDAGSDAGNDAPIEPDVPATDAPLPLCVIDDSIPEDPLGCCNRQSQRCTDSCGSFVSYCDPTGCCVFTGP